MAASAWDFFRSLWGSAAQSEQTPLVAELRLLPEREASGTAAQRQNPETLFFQIPSELPGFIERALSPSNGDKHVYFGVALRSRRSGKKNDLAVATAVWAEVDLYVRRGKRGYVPRFETEFQQGGFEGLRKRVVEDIRKFPLRPSWGVWSGAGYHLYWLLTTPITLDSNGILQLEALNRAIGTIVGGDKVYNADRILRVPGTRNIKPVRPGQPDETRLCRIQVARPELVYSIDDLLGALGWRYDQAKQELHQSAVDTTKSGTDGNPLKTGEHGGEIRAYSIPIEEAQQIASQTLANLISASKRGSGKGSSDLSNTIRYGLEKYIAYRRRTDPPERFAEREREGKLSRSEADFWVVCELLYRGVDEDAIRCIFRHPGYEIGSKFRENGPSYLETTLRNAKIWIAEHPRTNPGPPQVQRAEGPLSIKIRKLASDPPRYTITVQLKGADPFPPVTVETTDGIWWYRKFRQYFWEWTGEILPEMDQASWESLLQGNKPEVLTADPEATTRGAIEGVLEELLEHRHPYPDIGLLKVHAGFNDDGVFFLLPTLCELIRKAGIQASRASVCELLRASGWDARRIKIRGRQVRVWWKDLANGQKEGGDTERGKQSVSSVPIPELFEKEGIGGANP